MRAADNADNDDVRADGEDAGASVAGCRILVMTTGERPC